MTRLKFRITGGHPNLDLVVTLANFAKTHGISIFKEGSTFLVDAFNPQPNWPLLQRFCKQHGLTLTLLQREDITPCLYWESKIN